MKSLLRISLLGAALLLSACASKAASEALATPAASDAVIAEGHVRPVAAAALSFQARGIVESVLVKQGGVVKQGDVLARLANAGQAEAQAVAAQQAYDLLLRDANGGRAKLWKALMEAQKVRETATEKWDDLNLNDIENRIEDRGKDVEDRLTDLKQEQADFDKVSNLNKEDAKYKDRQNDLDHAQNDYDEAVKKLEETMRERDVPRANLDAALAAEAEAKHQYDLSADGPNAEQLALAKAQLDSALAALSNYELRAPFDGTVADVNVWAGEQVGPETPAVSVADFSRWVVETDDVTELEVVRIQEGRQVSMVPDALPDLTLTGTVEYVSQSFVKQGGDILYTVHLTLDKPDPRLRWGMTVEVTFPPVEK